MSKNYCSNMVKTHEKLPRFGHKVVEIGMSKMAENFVLKLTKMVKKKFSYGL